MIESRKRHYEVNYQKCRISNLFFYIRTWLKRKITIWYLKWMRITNGNRFCMKKLSAIRKFKISVLKQSRKTCKANTISKTSIKKILKNSRSTTESTMKWQRWTIFQLSLARLDTSETDSWAKNRGRQSIEKTMLVDCFQAK